MRDVLGVEDATVEGISYDWFSEEVRQAHKTNVEALEDRFREQGDRRLDRGARRGRRARAAL